MAFSYTELFPSNAPNGDMATVWTYTTVDALSTVLASGYFNTAASLLGIGDVVFVCIVNALPANSRTSASDMAPLIISNIASGVVSTKALDFTRNVIRMLEDFDGATIPVRFAVTKGSDGATVNFANVADTSGRATATTGAGAGGTMAVNGVQLHTALNWKANQGNVIFEARVKISAITNIAVFVGLTDQVAALEMPVNSAGSLDTITTTATDACGFMFDTAMTTDDIWLVGVANDVDAALQDSALAFVADTYRIFRIELTTAGVATFFIDGAQIGAAMSDATRATIALTPVVAAFTRTAASATISIDYMSMQAYRA